MPCRAPSTGRASSPAGASNAPTARAPVVRPSWSWSAPVTPGASSATRQCDHSRRANRRVGLHMLQMLYWVDESDHLARVDEAWREFALENGAPELASERILGRPIASFCSDATTSWIWGLFLARARQGVAIDVQIRCD